MTSINQSLVVRVSGGQPKLVKEGLPLPTPSPGQVQVKVSHVAQNPTDGFALRLFRPKCSHSIVQCFDSNAFGDGAVLGCDFVGEVTELGDEVTQLALGDIVAGLIWGGE